MCRDLLVMLPLLAALTGCGSTWSGQDRDGDGYSIADGDCWDSPEGKAGLSGDEIHPGARELYYDGLDQNCDGHDDYDADADGWVPEQYVGMPTSGIEGSGELPGGDCWDLQSDPPDADDPVDGVVLQAADVHPDALESWYDGIDQDCAGDDDFDQDGDGYRSAFHTDAVGAVGADCIDGSALDTDNPAALPAAEVHPDAEEICYDGTDGNCDGWDDDDCDRDGYVYSEECDDTDPEAFPDPSVDEAWYNGADENCDGNDGDKDGDGYLPQAYIDAMDKAGIDWATLNPDISPGDCWDDPVLRPPEMVPLDGFAKVDAADVSPDSTETFYDGVDQNCGGGSDFDADRDGYDSLYWPNAKGQVGADCFDDAADPFDNPGGLDPFSVNEDATETWYDGTDADCDGHNDYDQDEDGYEIVPPLGSGEDCDDGTAAVNPSQTETCATSFDDDCSGTPNDQGAVGCTDLFTDGDGDGYGMDSVCICYAEAPHTATMGGDCDDSDAARSPAATEVCDGADLDENCNGMSDDEDPTVDTGTMATWYVDGDNDGYGGSGSSMAACDDPSGGGTQYSASSDDCNDGEPDINPGATEVCGGADEDCDGLEGDDDPSVSPASQTRYYPDDDRDDYGDDTDPGSLFCEDPSTGVDWWQTNNDDCDDATSAINPDADEVCDTANTDEDCDGGADNDDESALSAGKSPWWPDDDKDGYGDMDAESEPWCDDPSTGSSWYQADDTDCDDDDDTVYPGASELDDVLDNDCDEWVDEGHVSKGDLIVVEARMNPLGYDGGKEWFELVNASSSRTLDLSGFEMEVSRTSGSWSFWISPQAGLIIAPGERLLLCQDGDLIDTTTSGGVVCDYTYATSNGLTASMHGPDNNSSWSFNGSTSGRFEILQDSVSVDVIDWDPSTWPTENASWGANLDPAHFDATDNDDPANWCHADAKALYDGTNRGTPGQSNQGC